MTDVLPRGIAKPYKNAMVFAVAYQVPLFFFFGLLTDGGVMLQMFVMAMVAFWPSVALIIRRSPTAPSRFDLLWIRAGGLVAMVTAWVVAPWIWRLRGGM